MSTTPLDTRTTQMPAVASVPAGVILSSSTLTGTEIRNTQDQKLGNIHDIMLNAASGQICYAVLSSGGFLGMGDRLFAIPWSALQADHANRRFILDVDVDRLKEAPGFDRAHWPDMADSTWTGKVQSYFAAAPKTPGN